MSTLSVDTIQGKTTAGTVAMPAGAVLQVANSTHLTTQSSTSTTYADISGLSVNITPKFSSSKILLTVDIGLLSADDGNMSCIRLLRDSTVLAGHSGSGVAHNFTAFATGGGGGQSGSSYGVDVRKVNTGGISVLDSPSTTSQITYKCQLASSQASTAVYMNRWALNSDMGSSSSITVMEIAG